MTTSIGAIAPSITCDNTPLPDAWIDELVQLRVEKALGLVGRATLRFTDTGFALSATDKFGLGKRVTVGVPGGSLLFTGNVTGVSLEQFPGSAPELVVTVDDGAYKLARTSTVTTYLSSSYTRVIRQIATRNSLGVPQITGPGDEQTFDYLLQAGNDLEFLNTITSRLGVAWWIDEQNTLWVRALQSGAPTAQLTLGEDLEEFTVRASALRPTTVAVNGWDPASQVDIKGTKADPGAGSLPQLVAKYANPVSNQLPAATASIADLPPLTAAEATMLAGSLYNDVTTAAVVARGVCNVNSSVAPGHTIQVMDAGPVSGNYVITEVEHIFDRQGFNTRFVSGPQRPAGLVDTLGIPAPDPGFLNPGLIVAVISNVNDDKKAGRVKVRYTGLGEQVESPWARVVTIGGGNARGALFQPEVNDEVLVAFEHGDTRRPVVIGGLYSEKNTMPIGDSDVVADGKVTYRRITSRNNHAIELSDGTSDDKTHIQLLVNVAPPEPAGGGASGGGPPPHKLRLGADRFDIALGDGKAATIQVGTAKFDISTSGDVTIEGNNITIKAKQALNLEATTTATLKGTQKATVQGAQTSVEAQATGTIQADAALTIKGTLVKIN